MRKYRVSVTPREASSKVWDANRCVYSVSVGVHNKPVDDLVEGLLWTKAKFERVAILVGDTLYAMTLQIQRGCTEPEAYSQAINEADSVISALTSAVGSPLEIFRTGELATESEFLGIETQVKDAYFSIPAFAGSVEEDARGFVRRQKKQNRLGLSIPVAEALARHYLIREIAAYAYLASGGWLVDVYLGSELPTLARIMERAIPPVCPQLARRVNISLELKETR